MDGKYFEKWVFTKRWRHGYSHVISLTECISNTDSKLLSFQISPARCGQRTCDALSEWNLRFKIPPAWRGPGPKHSWRKVMQILIPSSIFNILRYSLIDLTNLVLLFIFPKDRGWLLIAVEETHAKKLFFFVVFRDLKSIVKQFTRMWNSRASNLIVVLVTLLFCYILVVLLHFLIKQIKIHIRLHGIFTCTWIVLICSVKQRCKILYSQLFLVF